MATHKSGGTAYPGGNAREYYSDAVPDDKLSTLATHVPHGKYTYLAIKLGITFNQSENILTKHGQDYMKAVRECLAIWKARSGGSIAELEEILCRAEIGALRKHIESDRLREAFERAKNEGESQLKRGRIMFVGAPRAGKTSLLKRLIREGFNDEEPSTVGVDEEDKIYTPDVSGWNRKDKHEIESEPSKEYASKMTLIFDKKEPELIWKGTQTSVAQQGTSDVPQATRSKIYEEFTQNNEPTERSVTYHLWDFGGQRVYNITHPIFLTWRALFVLVFDLSDNKMEHCRQEEQHREQYQHQIEELKFWMKSIYTYAVPENEERDDPKVIIVGTHANDVKEEVPREMATIKDSLQKESYGQMVIHYLAVDNKHDGDPKFQKLRNAIDDHMNKACFMMEKVPTRWMLFEDLIYELMSKRYYLRLSEMRQKLNERGITTREEIEACLLKFHDLGKIVYFHRTDLVVLNPQWLNTTMVQIIGVIDEEKSKKAPKDDLDQLQKEGILTEKLVKHLWTNPYVMDELLEIMIRFDLICEISEARKVREGATTTSEGMRRFFVPCLVDQELEDFLRLEHRAKFTFIIDFSGFLPIGFRHRLLVRMAHWSMTAKKTDVLPHFRQQEMTFFVNVDHQVVMKVLRGDFIEVSMLVQKTSKLPHVDAKVAEEFTVMLRKTMQNLKEKWARRIQFAVGVKCPKCYEHNKEIIPMPDFWKRVEEDVVICRSNQRIRLQDNFDLSVTPSITHCTDSVGDALLDILCEHIPPESYNKLSNKLGIGYNGARGILTRFNNDCVIAIRECLAMWKNRTGGSLSQLSGILQEADLGDLIRLLAQDGFDDVLPRRPAPRHRDNQGRVAPRYSVLSLTILIIAILVAVIGYLVYKNYSK